MDRIERQFEQPEGRVRNLREALDAVRSYNELHGMGIMMAEMTIGSNDEDFNKKRGEKKAASMQRVMNDMPAIQSFGLDFDFGENKFVRAYGNLPTSAEGNPYPQEIRLNIKDGGTFISFLKSLTPELVQSNPPLVEDIRMIVKTLTTQVSTYYNFDDVDDRLLALLRSGEEIITELQRLGLTTETTLLAQFIQNAKRKTIREFRALRDAQCFDLVRSHTFGPSEWHIDISREGYKERWQKAITAIEDTRGNPNALVLVQDAARNLIACAESAITDMNNILEKKSKYDSEYREKIRIAEESKRTIQSFIAKE